MLLCAGYVILILPLGYKLFCYLTDEETEA